MLQNLVQHLFPDSGGLDNRFQSFAAFQINVLAGLPRETLAFVCGDIVRNLRVRGSARGSYSAQVVNLGRTEVEQE